jgi:hypothetical protein
MDRDSDKKENEAVAAAEASMAKVPDYLSQTVAAVLQRHVTPFLVPTRQKVVVQHEPEMMPGYLPWGVKKGSAAAAAVPLRREEFRATSHLVRPDVPLTRLNRALHQTVVSETPLQIRTRQFRDLLAWMARWCEVRRDLLIDVTHAEQEYRRKPDGDIDWDHGVISTKTVGVDVLQEPARLADLGLPTLAFPTQHSFLRDPIQVEARDIAWRAFLVGKTPAEYDAALARFRTTMDVLQDKNLRLGSGLGWYKGTLANAAYVPGNGVSALEAVIQLVLGRNLVNGDDYFMCMMWALLDEFGAYAAWVVASFLVWMCKYSGLLRYQTSMPGMFAHVARVMLDKDPRSIDDLKAAEAELDQMRHPFDNPRQSFDYTHYGVWKVIRLVWKAQGKSVEELLS